MNRFAWATGGLLMLCLALAMLNENSPPAEAQLPVPRSVNRTAGTIVASDCSIKLILEATLAAERPGIIAECELEEGDQVLSGKPVARLKDGVAVAALNTARHKANNDINERFQDKAWKLAKKELEIAEEANQNFPGAVPLLEIDKLLLAAQRGELAYEQAQFEREQNRKLMAEAEEQLRMYTVVAPFDGFVSKVHRHVGEAVTQGAPILEIISTERMQVEGYVTAQESYEIHKGDVVELRTSIPGETRQIAPIAGRIVMVAPSIEPVLGKVKVTAHVANENSFLKEGLNARLTIRLRSTRAIPRTSP